ncbi:hypothetical protein GUITHDRAFT_110344 [Guillardia theta CCMP2712]|uniref:Uncharacterized protein n=1 Tax=Guillardia theta (strain CCMP2712) TaxID=905079 RepID=L1J4T0_GUITC|nr:hypothetical protein GUITHDRAFT_110344 [Guillardia theta CCMP2712]EKX43538.1 hypothetical protein GUITHDRAFT_110344 [Guillardia theta CCMP2712]|eukprot:XP_005830518.1 hypothetical protein GUITHDRAFT_110344 [Guillardia theta CCMP2712]
MTTLDMNERMLKQRGALEATMMSSDSSMNATQHSSMTEGKEHTNEMQDCEDFMDEAFSNRSSRDMDVSPSSHIEASDEGFVAARRRELYYNNFEAEQGSGRIVYPLYYVIHLQIRTILHLALPLRHSEDMYKDKEIPGRTGVVRILQSDKSSLHEITERI